MASGTMGAASLAAATNTTLYTVTSGKVATLNVNFVNTGSTQALVRLAVCATATPAAAEWVEYEARLAPAGSYENGNVLERTALVVEGGKLIVAYSDNAGVTARVYGMEA